MTSVLLVFRKPAGGFSIEGSFEEILQSFAAIGDMDVRRFVSSHPSRGLVPRVRAMLEARRQRADVFHITGDVHFLALALPARRTILTVHDCHFLQHARSRFGRWLLRKLWLDWPVARCRVVTAVSNATREQIIGLTGCRPDKVRVIPTAISSSFVAAPRPFNASCPTILQVGTASHKNLERHVEALAGLHCRLRIIGKPSAGQAAHLDRLGIEYRADCDLDADEVVAAYRDSDIVLFASLIEGFGMPIIEAQATGRVVVTSDRPPMSDVCGGAACLVDPLDPGSIRRGLERVIQDSQWREGLIRAGYQNARRYGAGQVAASYHALYASIVAGSRCSADRRR
jgi:glycosyltransferase involved in cell wall biosynthesis